MVDITALAIGAGVGFLVGRFFVHRLQNSGERLVSATLVARFAAPRYHLLNNVTLSVDDGTTQIDHVLVSRFGVFVIETKHYGGWIFANANGPTWTQVLFKKKSKFQNPLRQNFKHLKAVQGVLDFLPAEQVHPTVVFTGDAEFRTPRPAGVFSLGDLVEHLEAFGAEVISENRLQFCVGRLECQRLSLTRETDVAHRERLQRKFGRQ